MHNFYVYILKCNDGSYYVGHTDNLEQRIYQHQNKAFDSYTSTRLPIELLFKELFYSREEAFFTEQKIKKWSRKKKEALINGDLKLLSFLAKKIFNKV